MADAPRRKIALVTGSRADYGIQRWLISDLKADPRVDFQLVCTGSHLSPELGKTEREILADGHKIDARVEMLLASDSWVGATKSLGLATIGFADTYERLQPDLIVLLGDRFEILAAAQAAMMARIPLAHLHGGEVTEGAIDESIRHAITKMAHLHFVSAEPHAKRVIQLGEDPKRVHCFGAPGLDAIRRSELLSREALEKAIDFKLGSPFFLVTYHPATRSDLPADLAFEELLAALRAHRDATVLITYPNADPGGVSLIPKIEAFTAENPQKRKAVASLGHLRYLSAVRAASLIIGNSSSGLIEVPALGKPTVNLGDRQRGRLRGPSVIDCAESRAEISGAIERALSTEFAGGLRAGSPYGQGDASKQIAEVLATVDLASLRRKAFRDLPLTNSPVPS